MWGNIASEFDRGLVETMEGPMTIAVSSCWVYRKRHDMSPSLEVCKYQLEDPGKERLQNIIFLSIVASTKPRGLLVQLLLA
ncbi:hypothetical protein Tco_0666004 [Tanacetum coccineum]